MKMESQLSTQREKQSMNKLEERLAELEMERKQAVEAHRKSESQHRSLLENMPSGIAYHKILVDEDNQPIDYVFLDVNEAFEKLTGLEKEAILGKKVTEVVPGIGESEYDWVKAYGRVALTGQVARFEQYSEALERWYSISAYSPERGYFVAIFSDVTDHKQADEELGRHRLHLEELVEKRTAELVQANESLQEVERHLRKRTYDLGERVKELNCFYKISNLVEIPGISLEEVVQGTADIIPLSWQYPESTCARITVKGQEYRTENFRPTDRGLTSSITIQGELSGCVEVYYLGEDTRSVQEVFLKEEQTLIDVIAARLGRIIERKLVTDELHKSEERYRQLVESINEGFWVIDRDCRTTFVNDRMAEMLGYTVDEMLGERLFSFMDEIGVEIVKANVENLGQGISEQRKFESLRKKDGTFLHVMMETSPFLDDDGNYAGAITVVMDITQRKIMEEQLKQAQKLEAIGQLAAGIAHEINTPIQYIGDNIRFLQEAFEPILRLCIKQHEALDATKRGAISAELMAEMEKATHDADIEYLRQEIPLAIKQTLEGTANVAKIVQTMKEFSHPGTTERVPIDINKSIETTVTVTRNEWKYVADVEADLDAHLPVVLGLPGELNQAILNLITNAAHAIAEMVGDAPESKGLITISTRDDGDWVEIRVSDTGAGIPEEIRTKVFEPFFTTKEVGKGTGQGLSIVHNIIVEKHGGMITFESKTGEGTTFIIQLPINYGSCGLQGEVRYHQAPE